ncbi:hypothetical protein KsCSTR_39370 [Candidatus Kuenenia stuttgartiensis]|uniref:Uncharacterized protein n=1 Tax=Kuenenia stuttgartiensis TaxID=174633 RepID=Q1PUK9_KUEST|nr:hypothetical protein KsCSTR_39370 [Candidatus Kuenenia stuttgartiensis]CAJ70912.1 unknown protein [Candidatus Kuenenia stuttgartiensis]
MLAYYFHGTKKCCLGLSSISYVVLCVLCKNLLIVKKRKRKGGIFYNNLTFR